MIVLCDREGHAFARHRLTYTVGSELKELLLCADCAAMWPLEDGESLTTLPSSFLPRPPSLESAMRAEGARR